MELILNKRELCDFELLVNDSFHPLDHFMNYNEYLSVLENMRLLDDTLFPLPIVLSINEKQANDFKNKEFITIKDEMGLTLGQLVIEEYSIYPYDWKFEAQKIFGTDDDNHPYIQILKDQWTRGYKYHLGGKLINTNLPKHYDFEYMRLTPMETKKYFRENNWDKIVGFQTRNPLHKSHYHLTLEALKEVGDDAKLLLHPVIGLTQDCDIDYHTRVRCYQNLLKYYELNKVLLSLLNLSMRMGGPRECLLHAIIRKNYGCTHFIVGRDHAGPSYKKKDGTQFFNPYDAQDLLIEYASEIGIIPIISKNIVYVRDKLTNETFYTSIDKINNNDYEIFEITGTQQRELLTKGKSIPEWFSFPEVIEELRNEYKPLYKKGLCIYLVGLSGCGKTTLANALINKFREILPNKKITYLDGDIVRNNLSKGLGFSQEDRSTNVRRIGFVASQVVRHDGICIVANIAPYKNDRIYNKNIISTEGNYFQVWINTSLEECEKRDVKGLYKLAREGKIKEFTGISDPFQIPDESDLILEENLDINDSVNIIVNKLRDKKFIY
jgi:sulfate adenylyltransferase